MSTRHVLPAERLDALLDALHAQGRQVIGPTLREGAIVFAPLRAARELPAGWTEVQSAGSYRLARRDDGALFGFNNGPESLKRWLHPPRLTLFTSRAAGRGFTLEGPPAPQPLAVIGARACDLAAMQVQDGVFQEARDPHYAARRASLFIVAVQCGQAAPTCFCPSMGTGPALGPGFDLALTEITEPPHRFVVEAGSPAGQALLDALDLPPAGDDAGAPEAAAARAEARITRAMPTEGLRERLLDALEHPAWDEVASRCLGCANCTLVCPTCFCTTVDDRTDLDGAHHRERRWDSCFNLEFSHLHGQGPVRAGLAARYRQWLTHKLATWHDQFGRSGCVGCGRCATWCPAGIDIVAEATRITEA